MISRYTIERIIVPCRRVCNLIRYHAIIAVTRQRKGEENAFKVYHWISKSSTVDELKIVKLYFKIPLCCPPCLKDA